MTETANPEPGPDDPLRELRASLAGGPHPDRRLGRALAFQTLYEVDLAHHSAADTLERLAHVLVADAPSASPPDEVLETATEYAREILDGVLRHRREIDALIHDRAPAWPLSQMSAIDRNVLRVGLYETLYGSAKVPLKAAINEAVELAKAFGSETSGKFVNGVLGRAVDATRTTSSELPRAISPESLPGDDTVLPGDEPSGG